MTQKEYIDKAESALLHTYNRYQVVFDHGDGVYLYDLDGKKYLDFVAGISVFAFGYNCKEYNDAVKAQVDKIIHTSNYYYNVPAIEAAVKLKEASGMDRVFFTNSGAEAIEDRSQICFLKGRFDRSRDNRDGTFLPRTYDGSFVGYRQSSLP